MAITDFWYSDRMTILIALCCLCAFAIGGIPFGYLVGRLVLKDDIRRHGSGNIGATNVARVIGWRWGGLVLVLDAFKGLLPSLATGLLVKSRDPDHQLTAEIIAGVSAIVGHMYPVWLRLRGGKGVATALGVIIVIAPVASGVAVAVFAAVAAATRIIALASITAVTAFATAQFTVLFRNGTLVKHWPLTAFALSMPALIVWRHRSNISRLWRGEEKAVAPSSVPPA